MCTESRTRDLAAQEAGFRLTPSRSLTPFENGHITVVTRPHARPSALAGPLLPELSHGMGELLGPLPWEKQLCALKLDNLARARDRAAQPIGPFDRKERIRRAPHDQRRRPQFAKQRRHR